MTWLARLFGFSAQRSEAVPAAASTTAASPPAIPVVAMREGAAAPSLPPLSELCLAAGFRDFRVWAEYLRRPLQDAGIVTRLRLAAALANFSHETGGGSRLVENMDYSPSGAAATFGRRATDEVLALCRQPGERAAPIVRQAAIANLVYGGEFGRVQLGNVEPGDGWRFRGRGLIQITGRSNYTRVARQLGVSLETLIAGMELAPGSADTACRWWRLAEVNAIADTGDIRAVRRRVNGGEIGLADVGAIYARVLARADAG